MKSTPKNYDVIIAFVIFLGCILFALFFNMSEEIIVAAGVH